MYLKYFQLISTWKQLYCIIAEKMAPWLTTLGIFGKDPSSVASPHVGGGGGTHNLETKIFEKREVSESFSSLL